MSGRSCRGMLDSFSYLRTECSKTEGSIRGVEIWDGWQEVGGTGRVCQMAEKGLWYSGAEVTSTSD